MLRDKWDKNGKYHFYVTLVLYLVMMLLTSVLIAFLGKSQLSDHERKVRWVLEVAVAVMATGFAVLFFLDTIVSAWQQLKLSRYIESVQSQFLNTACSTTLKKGTAFSVTAGRKWFWQRSLGIHATKAFSQLVARYLASWLELVNFTTVLLNLFHLVYLSLIVSRFSNICIGTEEQQYSDENTRILGFAALFGWSYMLFFARGWRELGHLVVTIAFMLAKDVFRFVLIYAVISLAYSQTIFIVSRTTEICLDGLSTSCVSTFGDAWWSLFRFTIGDIAYLQLPNQFTTPIYLSFSLVSNILILNLLIALMNNTFMDVAMEADRIWLHQWADYILLAERRPTWRSSKSAMRLGAPDIETRYKRALAADVMTLDTGELAKKHRGSYEHLKRILQRPDAYHLIHEVCLPHVPLLMFDMKACWGLHNKLLPALNCMALR